MSKRISKTMTMWYVWLMDLLGQTRRRLAEEQGDTNFISIAIILGIVLVIAGTFITWKGQIMGKATEMVTNFLATFQNESTGG